MTIIQQEYPNCSILSFYFNYERHFLFVYIVKHKNKKFADFIKKNRGFSKFYENQILLEANLLNRFSHLYV